MHAIPMQRYPVLLVLLTIVPGAFAQTDDFFVSVADRPVSVTMSSVYQRYEDDDLLLEQVSFPLAVSVPIGQNMGLSLLAAGAAASGHHRERLSGIADAQLGLSYFQNVGQASVVLTAGVNLPSGKQQLTPEEFATSVLVSRNYFGFRLPALGQGLSFTPSATLALPIGDALVIGAGLSYQYKQAYTPISTIEDEYDPGEAVLLTGGADIRLSEGSALSGDVTYTRYASDELGGEVFYGAGDKVAATLQFQSYRGFNVLRILGRFTSRGKGEVPAVGGGLITAGERVVPNQGRVRASYRLRTTPATTLSLLAQARLYGETANYDSKRLVDVGVLPELRISKSVSLLTRFIFTAGSFTGIETGVGISADV